MLLGFVCQMCQVSIDNALPIFNSTTQSLTCFNFIPEFAITFLGTIEAALVVTTINPWYSPEEISRQLISSKPKAIFTLVDKFDVVKEACALAHQLDTKIIAIKSDTSQMIRSDMINFDELKSTNGMHATDYIISFFIQISMTMIFNFSLVDIVYDCRVIAV